MFLALNIVGPDRYRTFGADANTDIKEQENSDIDKSAHTHITSAECSYQILVTKTCNRTSVH